MSCLAIWDVLVKLIYFVLAFHLFFTASSTSCVVRLRGMEFLLVCWVSSAFRCDELLAQDSRRFTFIAPYLVYRNPPCEESESPASSLAAAFDNLPSPSSSLSISSLEGPSMSSCHGLSHSLSAFFDGCLVAAALDPLAEFSFFLIRPYLLFPSLPLSLSSSCTTIIVDLFFVSYFPLLFFDWGCSVLATRMALESVGAITFRSILSISLMFWTLLEEPKVGFMGELGFSLCW